MLKKKKKEIRILRVNQSVVEFSSKNLIERGQASNFQFISTF